MTKLLLNTGPVPLQDANGAPVPPGAIVLDDEMGDDHQALLDEGVLVYVRPSELKGQGDLANLSDAAREHASGNAEAATSDDAGVTKTPDKGGSA